LIKRKTLDNIFHRWGGATAVFFAYTHGSHDLCTGLLPAMLPLIKVGLGLTYLQSGILLSALTITSGASQFLGGWLGDKFNRGTVIALGIGGVCLSTLAVGLSPSYYPMLVIFVIMGLFSGAYHPSAVSTIAGLNEEARQGKAIALHMVGGSFGFAIGPILGGLIADSFGWRYAFIILIIPALVAIPLVLRKLRLHNDNNVNKIARIEAGKDSQVPITSKEAGLGKIVRSIALVTGLSILFQFVTGCIMSYLPIYMVDVHLILPAYATMMMGLVRGGGIIGSLFGGWLSDKWGRANAIIITLVSLGPIIYILTNLPYNAGLIIIFLIFGIFTYMKQSTTQPYLLYNVPPHLRSTILGIYFGLGMEGTSLFQPIAGHFMDIYGIAQVFDVIALISVGLSVITLLLAKLAK